MDISILLGILKRCVHLKAASQLATFNIDTNGIHSTACNRKGRGHKEQLYKEMEQWMDTGEKTRQPCISTFRLYIPSSSSLVLSNSKNGLDNLALRVLNTITYRQMSPVCD